MLQEIYAHKRSEVEEARATLPLEEVEAVARHAPLPRGFRQALDKAPKPALIAEVKKASPSRGLIRADFDPIDIAQMYERAGATCLSVLTDERYFQGSAVNLVRCREATALPVLRKDFLYDPYQVYESRAMGADAILLIVAMLKNPLLQDLYQLAKSLTMDVLVEVHDEAEVEQALKIGADLIGVNNRDLATFSTSLETSDRLLPLIGSAAIRVSESAIEHHEDVLRVFRAGADAVLIGTTFCGSSDIEAKVNEVMG